jgi:hypothetical protein
MLIVCAESDGVSALTRLCQFALTYTVDLDVDRIADVVWNKNAFDHLVTDDETKELVQALVAKRLASERSTDIISGKGNSLIMLLHGGPGTGKTFSAEKRSRDGRETVV